MNSILEKIKKNKRIALILIIGFVVLLSSVILTAFADGFLQGTNGTETPYLTLSLGYSEYQHVLTSDGEHSNSVSKTVTGIIISDNTDVANQYEWVNNGSGKKSCRISVNAWCNNFNIIEANFPNVDKATVSYEDYEGKSQTASLESGGGKGEIMFVKDNQDTKQFTIKIECNDITYTLEISRAARLNREETIDDGTNIYASKNASISGVYSEQTKKKVDGIETEDYETYEMSKGGSETLTAHSKNLSDTADYLVETDNKKGTDKSGISSISYTITPNTLPIDYETLKNDSSAGISNIGDIYNCTVTNLMTGEKGSSETTSSTGTSTITVTASDEKFTFTDTKENDAEMKYFGINRYEIRLSCTDKYIDKMKTKASNKDYSNAEDILFEVQFANYPELKFDPDGTGDNVSTVYVGDTFKCFLGSLQSADGLDNCSISYRISGGDETTKSVSDIIENGVDFEEEHINSGSYTVVKAYVTMQDSLKGSEESVSPIKSDTASSRYNLIALPAPKASKVSGGTYYGDLSLTLTNQSSKLTDATIYYSVGEKGEGTPEDPTAEKGTKYTKAITVSKPTSLGESESKTITVKAMTVYNVGTSETRKSEVVAFDYTFMDLVAKPSVSPGFYSDTQNTKLSSNFVANTDESDSTVVKYCVVKKVSNIQNTDWKTLASKEETINIAKEYDDEFKKIYYDKTLAVKIYAKDSSGTMYNNSEKVYYYKYKFYDSISVKANPVSGTYYTTQNVSLSCPTNNTPDTAVSIYYTMLKNGKIDDPIGEDGNPSSSAILLGSEESITVDTSNNIKAVAIISDSDTSAVKYASTVKMTTKVSLFEYIIEDTLPTPYVVNSTDEEKLESGIYYKDLSTLLKCDETRAEIYYKYTLNDEDIVSDFTKYNGGEIKLQTSKDKTKTNTYIFTLKIECDGKETPEPISYTYKMKSFSNPVFTPEETTYYGKSVNNGVNVEISYPDAEEKDVDIYYYIVTLSGATTDDTKTVGINEMNKYKDKIEINRDSKIFAIAQWKEDTSVQSDMVYKKYYFDNLSQPELSLEEGRYYCDQKITVDLDKYVDKYEYESDGETNKKLVYNQDYVIYYTNDGSTPSHGGETSIEYNPSDGIALSALEETDKTIKVIAYSLRYGNGYSNITSKTYKFTNGIKSPTADIESGTYYDGFKVEATCATSNVIFEYQLAITKNGTTTEGAVNEVDGKIQVDVPYDETEDKVLSKEAQVTLTLIARDDADTKGGTPVKETSSYVYTFLPIETPTPDINTGTYYVSESGKVKLSRSSTDKSGSKFIYYLSEEQTVTFDTLKQEGTTVSEGKEIEIEAGEYTLTYAAFVGNSYSKKGSRRYTFKVIPTVVSGLDETIVYYSSQKLKLSLSSTTGDTSMYAIKYTMNETEDPSTSGLTYSNDTPITLAKTTDEESETKTVRAVVQVTSGGAVYYGKIKTFSYTFKKITATVKPKLDEGIYHENKTIDFEASDPNFFVKYSCNYTTKNTMKAPSDPTTTSGINSSTTPLKVEIKSNNPIVIVKVAAFITQNGSTAGGEVSTFTYRFETLATPTATVKDTDGPFTGTVKTKLTQTLNEEFLTESSTDSVEIFYTINGDTPTDKSKKYAYGNTITLSGVDGDKVVLNAIAKHNGSYSEVVTYNYVFRTLGEPSVSNGTGVYPTAIGSMSVLCYSNSADRAYTVNLYYAIDREFSRDVDINELSRYDSSNPISISASNQQTILRVLAVSGNMRSEVAVFTYSFVEVTAPKTSLDTGTYYADELVVYLSTTLSGANIYYTTADTTLELVSSNKYSDTNGVTIKRPSKGNTVTLRAVTTYQKGSTGQVKSSEASWTYTFDTLKDVTAEKGTGRYDYSISEVLSCETEDASIKYAFDGDDPETDGKIYENALFIEKTTEVQTLKAVSCVFENNAWTYGNVVTFEYTFNQVGSPVASLKSGTYYSDKDITLSVEDKGATIRYTIDGSEPNSKSNIYSEPISFSKKSGTVVLKAKAWITKDNQLYDSIMSEYTYVFVLIDKPTATPNGVGESYYSSQTVELSTTWEGGTIYYTTDGTTPDPSAEETQLYEGTAITIKRNANTPVVLKAITHYENGDSGNSDVAEWTFKFIPIEKPTSNKAERTYYSGITDLKLSCATAGTTIKYTTDPTTPVTGHGVDYTDPLSISKDTTISAIAYYTDPATGEKMQSDVATFEYKFASLPKPTVSLQSGSYYSSQTVTISSPVDSSIATIRYAFGDEELTESSPIYTGSLSIEKNTEKSTILKTAVFADGGKSDIETCTYTFTDIPAPTSTPEEGVYYEGVAVQLLDKADDAKIYYTTDGSEPTKQSNLYTGTISVPKVAGTSYLLRAKAFLGNECSDTSSFAYAFVDLASPIILPDDGEVLSATDKVTINTTVSGGEIRYTLDGKDPTRSSTLYSGSINITAGSKSYLTVKAKVYLGAKDSAVVSKTYKIQTDMWEQQPNNTRKYVKDGKYVTGWSNEIDGQGNWYYFDDDGVMATGWRNDTKYWKGCWFYFDENGIMATGWRDNIQGYDRPFYFDTYTGCLVTGWFKTCDGNNSKNGLWYYIPADFKITDSFYGWQKVDSYWYYFKSMFYGYMATNEKIGKYSVGSYGRRL